MHLQRHLADTYLCKNRQHLILVMSGAQPSQPVDGQAASWGQGDLLHAIQIFCQSLYEPQCRTATAVQLV